MLLRVMACKSATNCATLITPHPVWGNFSPACSAASLFRIGGATVPPIHLCLHGEPRPGRRQAVKAEAAKRGRDSASLYGLTSVRFTVAGSKRMPVSSDHIELALRTPCDGIGNPAVDVRFMPAAPVDADPDLRWERAFGDLTVDGGAGQAGSSQDGLQADDTVWFSHGWPTCCWLFLRTAETRQDGRSGTCKKVRRGIGLRRRDGGEAAGSETDAAASSEADAMDEGQLLAEPAA
jgi:hypothetical protein